MGILARALGFGGRSFLSLSPLDVSPNIGLKKAKEVRGYCTSCHFPTTNPSYRLLLCCWNIWEIKNYRYSNHSLKKCWGFGKFRQWQRYVLLVGEQKLPLAGVQFFSNLQPS
jgi:hypothetical protein